MSLTVVLLTVAGACRADEPATLPVGPVPADPTGADPVTTQLRDSSPTPDMGSPREATVTRGVPSDDELLRRVREQGTLSVIVTLGIPYTPEPALATQAEIEAQRADICAAQDELMASLAGYQAAETTRLTAFPQLVLTVEEPALQQLLGSPLVAHVQENKLSAPAP